MSDAPGETEGFSTNDVEFVYENFVGMTIYTHTKDDAWLSWEETQALTRWLAGNVWKLPPA